MASAVMTMGVGIALALQLTAPGLAVAVTDGRSSIAGSARPRLRRVLLRGEGPMAVVPHFVADSALTHAPMAQL